MDIREFDDRRTIPEPEQSPESQKSETLREQGNRFASSGKDTAVKELSRMGTAFHAAADRLHEQNDYFAGWADTAAERIDNASGYFSEKNPQEIVGDIQDFSRRNPYVTIGGMFIAGLALSRLLKSGSGR